MYTYARSLINELTETSPIVSATSRERFLQLENKPLRKKATSRSICACAHTHARTHTDAHTSYMSSACSDIKLQNEPNH